MSLRTGVGIGIRKHLDRLMRRLRYHCIYRLDAVAFAGSALTPFRMLVARRLEEKDVYLQRKRTINHTHVIK